MINCYFKDSISSFLNRSVDDIHGQITLASAFDITTLQNKSWSEQVKLLKNSIVGLNGEVLLEFSIPRMGKRLDCVLLVHGIVFVLEFKVGQTRFVKADVDQVWDYALDLKNFHFPSHKLIIVPVLVATAAPNDGLDLELKIREDGLIDPLKVNGSSISFAISKVLSHYQFESEIDAEHYVNGPYSPTPTIVEAAISLYQNHSVEDITRSDAGAINLTATTSAVSKLIEHAKLNGRKIICFVTGVPGAGKTLVGLKVATDYANSENGNTSVYLSGNAPLVAILQEALARDKVKVDRIKGKKTTKNEAKQAIKSFIQIIHHYRDEYLVNINAPYDHVAIFDEAQRAWNREHTVKFMRQKKGQENFDFSEPEFLISCLDRHRDWAVIVCLVGEGQEINTGEAGISEWIKAIEGKFNHWEAVLSPNLLEAQFQTTNVIRKLSAKAKVHYDKNLHLSVSMRSFRAEKVSQFVGDLLNLKEQSAREISAEFQNRYNIVLTRNLGSAKNWLRNKARGSERFGLIVSSQAQRLKPFAIDVRSPINPINWFLDEKDDVRSSFYLEDVATEFHVQGLELDWVCVMWDGDLRYSPSGWRTFSFRGNKWQNIHNQDRQKYLINAYRVLLTRARQGIIIVVPEGDQNDPTRNSVFYDPTFHYLQKIGIDVI